MGSSCGFGNEVHIRCTSVHVSSIIQWKPVFVRNFNLACVFHLFFIKSFFLTIMVKKRFQL